MVIIIRDIELSRIILKTSGLQYVFLGNIFCRIVFKCKEIISILYYKNSFFKVINKFFVLRSFSEGGLIKGFRHRASGNRFYNIKILLLHACRLPYHHLPHIPQHSRFNFNNINPAFNRSCYLDH